MGISDVGMIFKFVGGLGMFLFGMDMMAKGLQQSAGGKMKQWLGVLTRNRLMAVLARRADHGCHPEFFGNHRYGRWFR